MCKSGGCTVFPITKIGGQDTPESFVSPFIFNNKESEVNLICRFGAVA